MNIAYILKYTFRYIYLRYFLLNLLYSCLLFSVSLKCSSFSFESYPSLLLLQKVSEIEVAPSKWTRPRVGRLPRLCRGRRRSGIVGGRRCRATSCRVLCRGTVGRWWHTVGGGCKCRCRSSVARAEADFVPVGRPSGLVRRCCTSLASSCQG